jgi:hypothetical protein
MPRRKEERVRRSPSKLILEIGVKVDISGADEWIKSI